MMINRILVPLDGTPVAESALCYAETLATAAGASVILLRVVPAGRDAVSVIATSETYLQDVAHRMEVRGLCVELAVTYGGAVADWIAEEVETRKADFVIMATHGRTGLNRLIHGSTAEELIARVGVPMMIVNAAAEDGVESERFAQPRPAVVVGLDGSEFAQAALNPARAVATMLGARIILVQVVPDGRALIETGLNTLTYTIEGELEQYCREAEDYLLAIQRDLRLEGLEAYTDVRIGDPAEQLRLAAGTHSAALMVLATHGRSGFKRALLGSVARDVLGHTSAVLLLVPPRARTAAIGSRRTAA